MFAALLTPAAAATPPPVCANGVDSVMVQPLADYNPDSGWYLNTSPVITAAWEKDSDDRWTAPLGLGIGRVVRNEPQPVDYGLAAYASVEAPRSGSDWSFQLTAKLLLPTWQSSTGR